MREVWIEFSKSAESSWHYGRYFFWKWRYKIITTVNHPMSIPPLSYVLAALVHLCILSAKWGLLTHLTGAHLRYPGMCLHVIWKRKKHILLKKKKIVIWKSFCRFRIYIFVMKLRLSISTVVLKNQEIDIQKISILFTS